MNDDTTPEDTNQARRAYALAEIRRIREEMGWPQRTDRAPAVQVGAVHTNREAG